MCSPIPICRKLLKHATRRAAASRRLHGRQREASRIAEDRDRHQQLDEREPAAEDRAATRKRGIHGASSFSSSAHARRPCQQKPRAVSQWRRMRLASVVRCGYCPSQNATQSRVGRSSDFRVQAARPSRRTLMLRDNGQKDWAALRLLGYSGGAVPELHRIPCLSALRQEAADHQRTFRSRSITDRSAAVKRVAQPACGPEFGSA